MSANNGDKARFHRARKRRIAKRIASRALRAASTAKAEPAVKASPEPGSPQA